MLKITYKELQEVLQELPPNTTNEFGGREEGSCCVIGGVIVAYIENHFEHLTREENRFLADSEVVANELREDFKHLTIEILNDMGLGIYFPEHEPTHLNVLNYFVRLNDDFSREIALFFLENFIDQQ